MDKGQSSRPDEGKGRWNSDTLYHHFERWLVQLERHYDSKFAEIKEATDKALGAVKEQTAAAFAANKESVLKTEESQRAYNLAHNDLTRKMETQANQFVGREKLDDVQKQFDSKIEMLKTDITRLQEGLVAIGVRRESHREQRDQTNWTIGQVIAFVGVLTGILVVLIEFLLKSRP